MSSKVWQRCRHIVSEKLASLIIQSGMDADVMTFLKMIQHGVNCHCQEGWSSVIAC
jgi:hypothetical protein